MEDVIQSLEKALIEQNWYHGDKVFRIGHPYVWVDADKMELPIYRLPGLAGLLYYFSMFYEEYPTPREILTDDYEIMRRHLERTIGDCFRHYFPFLEGEVYNNYINCTSLVRAQDYAYIKTYAGINQKHIRHIDIGPGLGTHAVWSREGFDSSYFGVAAIPFSYKNQRYFFNYVAKNYYDLVAMETFNVAENNIKDILHSNQPAIYHVPSWKFPLIDDNSIDLVTATWVLNEVTFAGILWLMSNCMRVLKTKGVVYIRDSNRPKPKRHNVKYDELLTNHGFKKIHQLDVENRVNFHGVPRIYEKIKGHSPSFEDLVEEYLGRFGIASQGEEYSQRQA